MRVVIVDDEPLARRALRIRLAREADVTIVGEAEDGPAAVERILAERPDLVFLDIRMPGLDGFQVLEQVWEQHLPMVVFVTAHGDRALDAFEVQALDYLLKPVTESQLARAVERARAELARDGGLPERERFARLLDTLDGASSSGEVAQGFARRLVVRERDRIFMVPVESLDAIEAAGNYVELVAGERRHLMRATLAELERRLDPARFARIHRSTIVHVDRVREIRPDPHGDADVVMATGATYRLSRAYRDRLLPG